MIETGPGELDSPVPSVRLLLASQSEDPALERTQPPAGFLSPAEEEVLAGLAHAPRRLKWLLGRWAAKRLVLAELEAAGGIPVRPDSVTIANEPSGQPYVVLSGEGRLDRVLSISHRRHLALAGLTRGPDCRVGVDLEWIEPRDLALVRSFFTQEEADDVTAVGGRQQDTVVSLVWSAKEAVLKLWGEGLRADARSVSIRGARRCLCAARSFTKLEAQVSRETARRPFEGLELWARIEPEWVITVATAVLGPRASK